MTAPDTNAFHAHSLLDALGIESRRSGEVVANLAGVDKWYGQLHVLNGIDLSVSRGECVCIVGPSGAGKSTLLRCINALESPSSGEITVNGERIGSTVRDGRLAPAKERDLARQRAQVGMVFQSFNLFPHMTALENVICGLLRVKGVSRREATPLGVALLERVGLATKAAAYPRTLSGGEQQRVAIIRALAMKPALMLFDEPTSALDPEMIGEVLDVMQELSRESMTMITVTHELGFARRAATRIVMISDGQIVEQGPPDDILDRPVDPRTKRFLARIL